MIERKKYLSKIKKDLSKKENILFLIGARQVGKTTLLKSLLEFGYISKEETLFLQGDSLVSFGIKNFDDLVSFIKNQISLEKLKYLIIDEAQYIYNIGLILKVLIDKIRLWELNFKVIVSGSGYLNIFRWMTDSLIWRKTIVKVYPLDWEEFLIFKWEKSLYWLETRRIEYYEKFFSEYVLFGSYPKVVLTDNPNEKYEILYQIWQDYLYKDIALFLKEKEIMKFQEFLRLVASKVCSKINVSQLVDELWIKRYVFEKFFFLIENTFLLEKIEWFVGGKVSKETKKYYKIYFNDIGILRYLLGVWNWVGDLKWKVVENFVFNWLNVNKESWHKLMYWNTGGGAEVDFVLQNQIDFGLVPIEVKTLDKDNFGKSYINFFKYYGESIKYGIITTKSLIKVRELEWKQIWFLSYKLIHNLKDFDNFSF